MLAPITPNLWFDGEALAAAEFYCTIFPDSRIRSITRYPAESPDRPGPVMTVAWELDGQPFVGLNGGGQFSFDESVSFLISCADQAEVDHYWDGLLADGGTEQKCGWLKDRFGLSWQVVPVGLEELLADADPSRAQRAFAAMLGMHKLDLAALRAAADGTV